MNEICDTCKEPACSGLCVTAAVTELAHGHRTPDVFVELMRDLFTDAKPGTAKIRILTGRKADYYADD